MNKKKLLTLAEEGFIPGPQETEAQFLERVEATKKKWEEMQIPFAHTEWARVTLKEIFDINPLFLPIFYSKSSLFFWQAGVSWIGDKNEVVIQLQEKLKKGTYFGYGRDELIAHEALHAARCAFYEPSYEEIFAYFSSEKWWRKILGPLIQNPWEVWPLFLFLFLSLFFLWGWVLTFSWITLGFCRLIRNFWTLRRAFKNILSQVGDEKKTRAILVRLTDAEIALFAKKEDVIAYGAKNKELRWQLIQMQYLDEKEE